MTMTGQWHGERLHELHHTVTLHPGDHVVDETDSDLADRRLEVGDHLRGEGLGHETPVAGVVRWIDREHRAHRSYPPSVS